MPDNEPYVDQREYHDWRRLWDRESRTPEEAGRLERDRDPIQPRWVNGMPHDPDELPSKDEL